MKVKERIAILVALGRYLKQRDDVLQGIMHRAYTHNQWFTVENISKAFDALTDHFLVEQSLEAWAVQYDIADESASKQVGIIMAGNIPLVGFHDLLCVFVAGHHAKVKLSDKDSILLPHLLEVMTQQNPAVANYIAVIERLQGFDAVLATGSNNSARYFESYFGKYPSIIRKNRNSVAVLDGTESEAELLSLGNDVFQYFGLGCRNVSKLYVPENYNFDKLLEACHTFNQIVLHHKYKNNFDYNYTLVILNKTPYHANGCIILTEEETIASRIAGLHYEYYADRKVLSDKLKAQAENIQIVLSKAPVEGVDVVPFGKAQSPSLTDYADGVDVMSFLKGLS